MGAACDSEEVQFLGVGGTRCDGVDDESDVAARDGEHVAVADHLAHLGVYDGLAGRDVRADRALVSQSGELRAGGPQFLDEGGQAAVAGVVDECRAQVGDEGGPEGVVALEHGPGHEPAVYCSAARLCVPTTAGSSSFWASSLPGSAE